MHSIYGNRCTKGVARGGKGEISPPPKPKKIVVENGVISEGSIFSNRFSKIKIKIQFPIEFSSKIFKISQHFAFFVQTRKKLTHGL